jgi:glycerol uptake facilitator-like aquaporin
MGSSKVLDTLQNVILVCSQYNGLMESDAAVANQARDLGHKLSKFMSPTAPVFDNWQKKWFYLDEKGNKHETEPPTYII